MPHDIVAGVVVAVGILLLGGITWLVVRAYRHLSEGRSVYTGPIDADRARVMYAAFGISEAHMRALHFDGRAFHVGGHSVPVTDVAAISCSAPRQVTVSNARVAHRPSWRYQRRDGGPDGRHAKNPKIMRSMRYTVTLKGKAGGRITVYDNGSLVDANRDDAFAEMTKPLWSLFGTQRIAALPPASSVEEIVERVNRFVSLAQAQDLEPVMTAYTDAVRALAARQEEYYAALARKGQADSAAEAAARRLAAGQTRAARQLYDRAVADQQALAATLDRISRDLAGARAAWIAIIQEVRDLDALRRYTSQG